LIPLFFHKEIALELAVDGTLAGDLQDDGQAVLFRDATGVNQLLYSALFAFDAVGRSLPARMELAAVEEAQLLRLIVEVTAAA